VLEDVAERLDKKLGEEYIKTMSLRARIAVLEKVVEWALTTDQTHQWKAELRRRAKEG
jgi:hypothetical protein